MPSNFEDEVKPKGPQFSATKRPEVTRAVGCSQWIVALLILITVVLAIVQPYTHWLWMLHDARQPRVFSLAYQWRGTLFTIAFALCVAVFYFNIRLAFRLSAIYLKAPETLGEQLVGNALRWFRDRGEVAAKIIALVFATMLAAGFSNNWSLYLLSQNSQKFGKVDPTYGLDIGFFVFELPWYREVLTFGVWLVVLTAALSVSAYVGLQVLASIAKIELSRPQVRTHLSLLIGFVLILGGARIWLTRYEIGLVEGTQFTGGGASAQFELMVRQIAAYGTMLVGLLTIARMKSDSGYRIPAVGTTICFVGYLVIGGFGGSIVQRVIVDPDRLDKEQPYAKRAIEMTRFAYGLESMEVKDFATRKGLTQQEQIENAPTLENMRLWDPEVLRWSLERLQSPKNYYAFHDVDIDRYMIGGKRRLIMLAPRDINLNGLDPAAQNWTNMRLRYTHGYGVAMAVVNEANAEGEPVLIGRDIPQVLPSEVPLSEPRIYYSDNRDQFGYVSDNYALVNTKEEEFSYPTPSGSATHRWTANRGVPIGGIVPRIAWSLALGDRTLLFASNITSDSRLLVMRNVLERSRAIYPFLKFDQDPYIAIVGGRLIWILDGYTITDMVPYSSRIGGETRVNYIRNSVKVVIDAYSGETNAYAIEPNEPILRAWMKIYPGLVRPLSEIPKGVREHFRYAEDLFKLQSAQLTQYHVTDPVAFLSNSEAWQMPLEQGLDRRRAAMRPYYVTIQVPGDKEPKFMLILPFTPNGKPNMSGWLGAHCDPEDYGKLTLFSFSKGVPVDGPEVMETNFNSWPEVSNINRQYQNDQSEIVQGNMLVIPIGANVLYLEPMFLRSKTAGLQARPRLFKVVLSLDNRIVVGDTYTDALAKLLGESTKSVQPSGVGSETSKPSDGTPVAEVRKALETLDQAEKALRKGDFASYGEFQKRARQQLEAILRAKSK